MAEQHDGDQRGQLPPEIHAGNWRAGELKCGQSRTVAESNNQGHGNQRHHARLLGLDFLPTGGQEHSTAGEEQDRTGNRRNEIAERERNGLIAKNHLNGVREIDCRNRQREGKPELLFENRRVVVRVVTVAVVTGVTRVHVVTGTGAAVIVVASVFTAGVTNLNLAD